MSGDKEELADPMAMDCDEWVDLEVPTADQTQVGSSSGQCQSQRGRKDFGTRSRISTGGILKKTRGQNEQTSNVPKGKRQRQIQHAINNAELLFNGAEDNIDDTPVTEDQQEQPQRLTEELVLQALFEQTPGLTFPSTSTSSPFSSDEIKDLVKALGDYQTTLSRKGTALQSPDLARLLKTFTHDVLSLLSRTKKQRNCYADSNLLWAEMYRSFYARGSKAWLRVPYMQSIDDIYGVGNAKRLRSWLAFNRALVAPGKNPEVDMVIGYARMKAGGPHYGHTATLRSLVRHFETARTQYLSSISHSEKASPIAHRDIETARLDIGNQSSKSLGKRPRELATDSSDEENDDLGDSGEEGDVEDNDQVEGELLLGKDRALIQALDLWMELSKEAQQGASIDAHMISSLDLGI